MTHAGFVEGNGADSAGSPRVAAVTRAWERLFASLLAARRIRLRVRSSKRDAAVRGSGEVRADPASKDRLLLHERGAWHNSAGSRAAFSNVSRFTRMADGRVGLEHLRHGEAHAVRLVDLETRDGLTWTSCAPYLCGADRYVARVRIEGDGVRIRWRICGPRKSTIVETLYRP